MNRYQSFKSSEIDWVGEIPSHWETVKPKFKLNRVTRPIDDDDEVVTCFRDGVVTLRKNRRENGFTNSIKEHGYQQIRPGDLVVHEMDGFEGAIGISDSRGKSTPVYTVIEPDQRVDLRYINYLLREMSKTGKIESLARSIRERTTDFRWNMWSEIHFPFPPIKEQQLISRYLDKKTEQIDSLVKKIQKKIELLKEQRTSLINQCVIKGLDPNVEMKDSGVEWVGEIPSHWVLTRIKYFLNGMVDTEHKTVNFEEGGNYHVVRTSNIKDGRIDLENTKKTNLDGYREWTRRGVPETGDVLLTREAPAGECGVIEEYFTNFCMGQRVVWLRVDKQKLRSRYLVYTVYGEISKKFISDLSLGSTVTHLNMSEIGNIPILHCPLYEQDSIVDYLDQDEKRFSSLVRKNEQKITLLTEYRQSLISSVVTGKVRVTEDMI